MNGSTLPRLGRTAAATQRQVSRGVDQATREARPWVTRLGRLGFAAKGLVYLLVGLYAVQAALGGGGGTTDTRGAIRTLGQASNGQFVLVIVAIGLAGYALWRFVQAVLDTDHQGTRLKGLVTRASCLVIGVVYSGLARWALRLSLGSDDGHSSDSSTQDWTAWLLSQPFGQWLVGLVGVIVLGTAVSQFYRAYSGRFSESLRLTEMTARQVRWARRIGQFGFAARGLVFAIVGLFLLVAAYQAQPGQARGLGGVLVTLAAQPFGPWLLGLVGLGLLAYGFFMLVEARYRRMVLG
jgi:uncharacterized protein DUF1206